MLCCVVVVGWVLCVGGDVVEVSLNEERETIVAIIDRLRMYIQNKLTNVNSLLLDLSR